MSNLRKKVGELEKRIETLEEREHAPVAEPTRTGGGLDLAELTLVLVFISIAVIAAMTAFGEQVLSTFCTIVTTLGGTC